MKKQTKLLFLALILIVSNYTYAQHSFEEIKRDYISQQNIFLKVFDELTNNIDSIDINSEEGNIALCFNFLKT